ncbi:MAG: exosortase system-associated protein, TIGR04073 family [Nitrospirota bacterium]
MLWVVLLGSGQAWAEEESVPLGIATKLARGAANFATGWAELPKQIYVVGRNEGWLAGTLRGPVDGLGMFVARTVAGMYEVLTFPIPIPARYQPMIKPDFVWEAEPVEGKATQVGAAGQEPATGAAP